MSSVEHAQQIAASLAIFQLGEAGEGRIARQIDNAEIHGIDEYYKIALKYFVKEEGRHARLLGACIHLLGGRTLQHNWTERLFVLGRRLLGIRLKLMVLLSAEVIGLCFYSLLAENIAVPEIQKTLISICEDEKAHSLFHCDFFRTQIHNSRHRFIFKGLWRLVGFASALVVICDHYKTLKALSVPLSHVWQKFSLLIQETEKEVLMYSGSSVFTRNFDESWGKEEVLV